MLEVEPPQKLEIQLNRHALEGVLQHISDRDIYLGAVERTISRIGLLPRVILLKHFRELHIYTLVSWYSLCLQSCRRLPGRT